VFGRGITPTHLTTYGVLVNGTNYTGPCRTRFGEYPYCDQMRLPSFSLAKSALAGVALMYLGQKFGAGMYEEPIGRHLPQPYSEQWMDVTFNAAADMATGHYRLAGFLADEDGLDMINFLVAEPLEAKLAAATRYPQQNTPQFWAYHTSDTFLLAVAMQHYLQQRGKQSVDLLDRVCSEVYGPLGLSAGAMQALRTDNSPTGQVFGGYGLFLTRDDVAKLARFLNNDHGVIRGAQILNPSMLDDSLQRNTSDRGVDTTDRDHFKYNNYFWAAHFDQAQGYGCSFWVPFMSGYGGITVAMLPNGATYYYFSDNNEFYWYPAVAELGKLKPYCP
jgi:CubicO group peptidase (beta-lactamase class C family)